MSFHRVALAVLLVLACSLARVPARAADDTLIEAARKEGRVLWYTTLIVNQAIRPLKDAFEKQYPGIELQYARAEEAPTAAKILTEGGASRPTCWTVSPTWCPSSAPASSRLLFPHRQRSFRRTSRIRTGTGSRSCSMSSRPASTPHSFPGSARQRLTRTCSIPPGATRWPGTRARLPAPSASSAIRS